MERAGPPSDLNGPTFNPQRVCAVRVYLVCVCLCVSGNSGTKGCKADYERYQRPRTNEGLKNIKAIFQK